MTWLESLRPYLPAAWLTALAALPTAQQNTIQELRLRAGQPLRLSLPMGERYLGQHGITELRQPGLYGCSPAQLEDCFLRFCDGALYAHQAELEQGFIAVPGGIRVGIAGRIATDGVKVNALRDITSLCIRLPREHRGCAAEILPLLQDNGCLHSALLVGEPASGKTSLLRDTAAGLAARGYRVAVVDERGELGGMVALSGCDVLQGCPKEAGIRQAIRCLAPEVVVFDELGDTREARAVAACAHAGVAVMSSLHGGRPEDLSCRPLIKELVAQRVFFRWFFLAGRRIPGRVVACLVPEVTEDEIHWTSADTAGRGRPGAVLLPSPISTRGIPATDRPVDGGGTPSPDLHRPAYGHLVATAGGRGRFR